MAYRKIDSIVFTRNSEQYKAIIAYCNEYGEYRVRIYNNESKAFEALDYFTDSLEDAESTGASMIRDFVKPCEAW